jgi:biopolymer transport protein ExbB
MIEILLSGGVVMIPLAACSILALAVIIDRSWSLRRPQVLSPGTVEQVHHWIEQGVKEEAVVLCRRVDSPMTEVLMAGLSAAGEGGSDIRTAVQDAGRQQTAALEKNMTWLGICATTAPLIGLLGTVTGMIEVFQVLALKGPGDPHALASGISEALVTTATGLVIAIPALLFYHYFAGRIDMLVAEMERNALQTVQLLSSWRDDR